MDAARFSAVEEVFHRASALAGEDRERALAEACGDDAELRREVEELLVAAELESTPLDKPAAANLSEPAPAQVGPYRIVRRLGQGGSSVVYLAEEEGEGFRRLVALKLLAGFAGEALLRRFAAETRILAGLEHPGIARFYSAGRTEDGAAYLALEYVEGTDLLTYCRERRTSLGERLRLFDAVLDAVDYAHRSLVVHRDIKPRNIQVSLDGRPKLLDFGIAALLDPAEGVAIGETATLLRALTPAYASPEQIRGERVTTASDIYSLGVVLYELLAGVRPHGASVKDELERGFREVEPEPPSTVARRRGEPADVSPDWRRLRGDLDAIALKALRRDPAARYSSVSTFAEDLYRHVAGLPVLARRHTLRYRTGRFLRRHAAAVATAAGVVLLAGAGLAWHVVRLQNERDRAHAAAEEARREAQRSERVVELLAAVFDAASPMDQPGRPLTGVELLEKGGARVDSSLTAEPELRAQLRTVLGGIWSGLGEHERATAMLESAVAELESRLGPDHLATAQARSTLGRARHRQGRVAEARQLFEKALAIQRRQLGERHSTVARTLMSYGSTLKVLGELQAARSALEQAVAILGETEGPESGSVGRAIGDLGLVLERLEDWDAAVQAHERSLAIFAKEYGRTSPRYAVALVNLGNLRSHQGRPEAAVKLLEEALRINQGAFGDAFPGESNLHNYLAWAYFDLHRYAEARREFERSVATAIREKGPQHTDAAWPLRGLAAVELAEGRLEAARRAYERARVLREQAHGPVHWEVAQSLNDLATVADRLGDLRTEETDLRQALAIRRQVHEPSHPQVAQAASRLGEFLCRGGGSTEGAALLAEAIALREKSGGADDEDLPSWRKLRDGCTGGGSRRAP